MGISQTQSSRCASQIRTTRESPPLSRWPVDCCQSHMRPEGKRLRTRSGRARKVVRSSGPRVWGIQLGGEREEGGEGAVSA